VLEYRHDLFSCPPGACQITDVSIPNFAAPPILGTSSDLLVAAAWRPGCDGGLIIGGSFTRALLFEFARIGGVSCAPPPPPVPLLGGEGVAGAALAWLLLALAPRLAVRRH
jgi:hypothetical protein